MRMTKFREAELPSWVWANIMKKCIHCNWPILENDTMTARWCSNPRCPEHMAHKIVEICKFLSVKGIGPKNARKWIDNKNLQSHFEIIPYLTEVKPLASLAEIAELACIEGYGKIQGENELSHLFSFEEYFSGTNINPLLAPYKDMLCESQKYFTVKKPLSKRKIYVMGTGSFHGFRSRDEYFNMLNDRLGQFIHVIQTGKRKTGVSYLIKEKDAIDHSKSTTALENGIPIVTSAEFIAILLNMLNISLEEFLGKQKED